MTALMSVLPVPLPELVIEPVLLTLVPERVIPLAIALLLSSVRLPVPPTPPVNVNKLEPLALLLVSVVPLPFTVRAPVTFNAEAALFSVRPVTLVPTPALMRVSPPVPELVIVPPLLTLVVESVRLSAVALLLLRTKLPVPVTPPDTVNVLPLVLVFVNVVPPEFTERAAVLMRSAPLFCVIPVTFEPTPPDIVMELPPAAVIVPPLLTEAVVKAMPPEPEASIVRLLLPVTPPLKVVKVPALFSSINVPLVAPAPSAIGLLYVPAAPTCSVAELLLLVELPNVTVVPDGKALLLEA